MDQAITAYIESVAPGQLLECSTEASLELQQFCKAEKIGYSHITPHAALTQPPPSKPDLILVRDALETLSPAQGQQLLGWFRNAFGSRIWLLLPQDTPWSLGDLIALGFRRDEKDKTPDKLVSYSYDLADYNRKRSWNNAKFWANPENFNKYRW